MKPQKIAVIGHPIGHTMSPFIHARLFALQNIPLEYTVLDLPDLQKELPLLRSLDGFNVTIPHKSGMIPFLDEVEEKARIFGSVNTVKIRCGRMTGFTTDGVGCWKALEKHGMNFSGELLLLGNGGAARAIAFEAAAREPRLHLTIACRTSALEKSQGLREELLRFLPDGNAARIAVTDYEGLEAEKDKEYQLLLNATSVGMYPKTQACPVSEKVLSRCGGVFDAVYNPGETLLLKRAQALGLPVAWGMEMLVYQAVAAHEIWYGSSFEEGEISRLLREAQEEMGRLFGGVA